MMGVFVVGCAVFIEFCLCWGRRGKDGRLEMAGWLNHRPFKPIIDLFGGARGIGVQDFLCVDTISGFCSWRGDCFNGHEKLTESPQSHCQ